MAIARATGGYLAQVKAQLDRVSSIEDPDVREAQVARLRKVADVLEQHAVQENAISVNANLSQKGQEAALAQLAQATRQKLGFLPKSAVEADATYGRAEALVLAAPDAPKGVNEIVQYLRESEIRAYLRSLSPAERMAKYLVAVQQDQAELIRAFRLAPGEPLIPDDLRERATRERIEATKPKQFGQLQSLDVVRSQLHELSDTLVNWLRGYGAEIKFPTPAMKAAQYLVGYGDEVKFPVPTVNPAGNRM